MKLIRLVALLLSLVPNIALAAISYVGNCAGTTSCTPPAHQVGDLFIGFTFRDGNNTAPTVPGGWTTIDNAAGADNNGSSIAYKLATTTSETSGTWTSATTLVILIYRGAHQSTPIGNNSVNGGSGSSTINFAAVTFTVASGTSWAVGFSGHRSIDTNLEGAPTGMTNRANDVDLTDEASGHDTNGGVTGWSSTSQTLTGTNGGWRTRVVEVVAAPVAAKTLSTLGVG